MDDGNQKRQLSLLQILSVVRSFYGLIIQILAYFILAFNTPILNTHLDKIGYSPKFISATITVVAICYALSIPIVQILTKIINKRGILFMGFVVCTTGMLFTGVTDET